MSRTEHQNRVPKLRFTEFGGQWEQTYLKTGVSLISGQHLSPDEYNRKGSGVPYFTGPSDYTNDPTKITKWTAQSNHFGIVNDVLITVKGSGVGALHLLKLHKVAMGRQLMAVRGDSFDATYIYQELYKRKQLFQKLAYGNMIPGISRLDILNTKLCVPALPEQQKIASFLTAVDKKIEQLTRKKELLGQYKKGVMQKIFSQEIRFKDDDGEDYPDWEEQRLGDLGKIEGGGTPSTQMSDYWAGDIPWVSSSDLNEETIRGIKYS